MSRTNHDCGACACISPDSPTPLIRLQRMREQGKELHVGQYMMVFIKFINSAIPTITCVFPLCSVGFRVWLCSVVVLLCGL